MAKERMSGKVVTGGKVITDAGLRYTLVGDDKQWALKKENQGKDVMIELDLTASRQSAAGGAAKLVKARRGDRA